jgi:hypothetical protein
MGTFQLRYTYTGRKPREDKGSGQCDASAGQEDQKLSANHQDLGVRHGTDPLNPQKETALLILESPKTDPQNCERTFVVVFEPLS